MWMIFLESADAHSPPGGDSFLTVLNSSSRLCLMGIAETPGCATLLPTSLFVSNHAGTDG